MSILIPKSMMSGFSPLRVPTIPVEIDINHPLAAGLGALYLPTQTLNDMTGKFPALVPQVAGQYLSPSACGLAITAGNYLVTPGLPMSKWPGFPLTLFTSGLTPCYGSSLTGGGSGQFFSMLNSLPYSDAISLTPGSYGTVSVRINLNNSYTSGVASCYPQAPGELPYASALYNAFTQVGSFDITTGCRCYTNGNKNTQSYTYNGTLYPPSTWMISMQGRVSATTNAFVNLGGFYNRVLSDSEALWLTSEPFIMFKPIKSRTMYYGAASSIIYPKSNWFMFG